MTDPKRVEFKVGTSSYVIETGEVAQQANGSLFIRSGDTMLLVTATASNQPREGVDFFPLMVDFEEKMYSIGTIPGNYIKREGRPPESAILTARLIDRPIRPLFPEGYRNDVQVVATIISSDRSTQADVLAMNGASAALAISNIPFLGPIGAVRVGRIKNKWVLNPTYEQNEESELDLVIAGTDDAILMVEAGANILNEEMLLSALEYGHSEIKKIVAEINKLAAEIGKAKQTEDDYKPYKPNEKLVQYVEKHYAEKVNDAMVLTDKSERKKALATIKDELGAHFEGLPAKNAIRKLHEAAPNDIYDAVGKIEKQSMRKMVIEDGRRLDGRSLDEIRPISSRVGLVPRAHGSGLFTRGTTQALSITTLGSMGDMQSLDEVGPETEKRYIHHYNFPAYSVGEVRPVRSPGRREIGHGALARRAIIPVLPDEEDFPYTIRVVSEILSSNGSTSMASTCGSTISLLNAGVPLKKMVGGVAMGLVKEGDKYAILSDILGDEDHLGDMDFKVTGTMTGITALQMDIKIKGISIEIMREALEQARKGRIHILQKMMETISEPSPDLSPYAPRIITMKIPVDKIGELIGPGGKNIKKIVEETGVKIDIEDDGSVFIVSTEKEAADKAIAWVEQITKVVEVGEIYDGKVVRITNFGAFVELFPGNDGLVHISQLSDKRVRNVEEVVSIGQILPVKVTEIDSQGRINLTAKNVRDTVGVAEDS